MVRAVGEVVSSFDTRGGGKRVVDKEWNRFQQRVRFDIEPLNWFLVSTCGRVGAIALPSFACLNEICSWRGLEEEGASHVCGTKNDVLAVLRHR